MAVDFRCANCGKLLSLDAQPGSAVQCPHCRKDLTVPEGLASLPRPHVPPNAAPQAARRPAEPPPEAEAERQEGSEVAMTIMAAAMPWVVSVFFHLGLLMVLALVTMIVFESYIPDSVIVPDMELSDNPGGVMNPGERDPQQEAQQPKPTDRRHHSRRESAIPADAGKTDKKIELIGVGAGGMSGGALAKFGLDVGGSGSGPRSSFFGSGGNAHHIVFVVDRSGSMVDTFDYVRKEMLRSISRLRPPQDFHVILFAEGPPIENAPKRLVPAEFVYKEQVAEFLQSARAQGQTDPVPALKRAFAVLSKSNRLPGKLIYLLTDGVFPDNQKVISAIRAANRGTEALINTYLYGSRPPEAEEVMKQIAEENGGRYRYVSPDE